MKLIPTTQFGGGWIRFLLVYGTEKSRGALFLCFGADEDLPFRPWPQYMRESRGKSARADWIALLGICLGWQRLYNK